MIIKREFKEALKKNQLIKLKAAKKKNKLV